MILTGSVLKLGKNYYPQVFLEECKYILFKKKEIIRHNKKDSEISSDEESSDEKKV